MQSFQTSFSFPLSSVKPLERLLAYREYCLTATHRTIGQGTRSRIQCLACELELVPAGTVDGLQYVRCLGCSSLFLQSIAPSRAWANLLAEISRYRQSPTAFHAAIVQSRNEKVYAPKLEWIQNTMRLHGFRRSRMMEVVTLPSEFTSFLAASGLFEEVMTVEEMSLAVQPSVQGSSEVRPRRLLNGEAQDVHVAVLLESLDRIDDPEAILKAVSKRLIDGGMIFITALVSSGFDLSVLGFHNMYLYPPDRTNCFSLEGLRRLLERVGFFLEEVSTPGVLDVEIVQAHLLQDPSLPLSTFERQILTSDCEVREAFQVFLQQHQMSSFARVVGRKRS